MKLQVIRVQLDSKLMDLFYQEGVASDEILREMLTESRPSGYQINGVDVMFNPLVPDGMILMAKDDSE